MVNLNASELLRRLSSGVRPDGTQATASNSPIESRGFADLLASARKGELRSERPLSLARGVEGALSENQLERLAVATDAAETRGAQRLVAVIDGKAVSIDVASRTVSSVEPNASGRVLNDADSFVILPSDETADLSGLFAAQAGAKAGPGSPGGGASARHVRNLSMANLLASMERPPTGE